MPLLTRRKRLTENASASRIAEADDVWHSTAIEESRSESNFPGISDNVPTAGTSSKGSSKGRAGPSERSVSRFKRGKTTDSGRGASETRDNDSRVSVSPSPIVINPPSGHSFFSSVLQKCGYIIKQPNFSNEMFYDVMVFRKKLSDWLTENEDEMKRIETETSKFLKALNAYLSERPNFISSMKPTKHDTELIQPSLLNCLLGIDALQPNVLKIVMPLMGEATFSTSEEEAQLVNTILNQLKWLPAIVEGEKFAENLLGMVDSATYTSQCQIIRLIPDILPTQLHSKVAEKLLEKFSGENLDLSTALMDCFSSLDIPEDFWSTIRMTAIQQMADAPLRDIPAYLAFLFRTETTASLYEIITTVRERVELDATDKSARTDSYQIEILEKMSFCITVNPNIVNIWLKQVKEDVLGQAIHTLKTIDMIMLLVFAESHKAAIAVLKLIFADKSVSVRLFSDMLEKNTVMVYQLFSTIAKFIDSLLRSKELKCLQTVCDVTALLFSGLSALEAQTLMGNMSGILINYPPSRDTVLEILTKLSEKEPKKLLLFAPYLMGMLEYVIHFPARQIRALMNVLAVLSQTEGKNSEDSNHFNAEFSILLRKQLTHSDIKIRCFGVYGALASIRQISARQNSDDERVKELLKLAWNFVERDEDACRIFFDELAQCVPYISLDICKMFRDNLKEKFQILWTVDEKTAEAQFLQYGQKVSLTLKSDFDANKECSQDRLVVIFENQPLEMSPLVIPAHIRVLAALESKVESGNLEGIDAILGCPILIPNKEEYYMANSIKDFSYNQRCHLGHYLVLAINFFRESVNSFIRTDNAELRIKLWCRLCNIVAMQRVLVKHFDLFPQLPFAYVEEKTIGSTTKNGAGPSFQTRFTKTKNLKKVVAKPSKKKARRDGELSDSESDKEDGGAQYVKKSVISLNDEIQPKIVFPHLRRFNVVVFRLLMCPLSCKVSNDADFSRILLNLSMASQNPVTLQQVEKFGPETLVLLLTELRNQTSDDAMTKLDILTVKRLLKYVCVHINSIVCSCEEEDADALPSEHRTKLECCLRLLINIMTSYFEAIRKLTDKEKKEKWLDRSMQILASQAANSAEGDGLASQAEIMANIATYLGGLVFVAKDQNTALDHIKLLKTIHDLVDGHSEIKKAIHDAATTYLKNDWKLSSAQVEGFMKVWLGTTLSPVKVISHLATSLLTFETETDPEINLRSKEIPNDTVYKSCTKYNFHTWYSAMMYHLSQYVYKNLRKRGDFEDSIERWKEAIDVFKDLVAVTKENSKTIILLALLRNCRLFLEAFISGGAELLPQYWKENKQAAQVFCNDLQKPSRTIQHICEHSKIHTDLRLLKSVPLVKRVLETLVFRVREVLAVNGAACAFWMGSLKHRDLKGDCINSQIIAEGDLDSSDDDDMDVNEVPLSGARSPSVVDEDSMDLGSPENGEESD